MTKKEQRLLIKERRLLIKEHIHLILWKLKVIEKQIKNLKKRWLFGKICLDMFIEKDWLLREKEKFLREKLFSLREVRALRSKFFWTYSLFFRKLWPITWRQRYMLGLR